MFYINKFLFGVDPEQQYQNPADGTGEQLKTQQIDDWVVVETSDKENCGPFSHSTPHTHHHHPHRHHHLHHPLQNPHTAHVGGHDSLSQSQSSSCVAEEYLDDADTLAQNLDTSGHATDGNCLALHPNFPLQDCGNTNFDIDSNCSSDTESSHGSVFSASSGRSHATYRPRGNGSEPWVVAPAPCFTGSQVGELNAISHSPMENLLIEHPSMSVYLSIPHSSRPPSHPFLSTRLTGENNGSNLQEEGDELPTEHAEVREEEFVAQDQTDVVPLQPRRIAQIIPPSLLSPQQIVKNVHTARRSQRIKTQENISNSKCDRQNKVRDYQGYTKGNNRKNKRMKPSGCKASRFNQRM
ncbi:unnamed protein product [Lymnaea stagnalis]|uniref:Tumor protein p53-inducible nuclear protein 1 n=1 Tax=Lymnaea stagnalis TaxID=6523 RepID=A0AAV2I5P3_LYMST